MTTPVRTRTTRVLAAVAITAALALTGCSTTSTASSDANFAPGVANEPLAASEAPVPMGGDSTASVEGGAMGAPTVDVATKTVVVDGKQVIRSASAVLGVDKLDAARAEVLNIVTLAGGTITNEYVYSGSTGPQPEPYAVDSVNSQYPYYGYDQYVDMTFTVPSAQYEQTMAKVRKLGEVVSVQQNAQDVTATVVDVDARIRAAQESVSRIEALLGEAKTLDETLRLEQELTIRQSNLESLEAQQKSMASQVADSTINVRLVPQKLIDSGTPEQPSDPTLWDQMGDAFVTAWSGVAIILAVTSPLLLFFAIVAVVIFVVIRRKKTRPSAVVAQTAAAPQSSTDAQADEENPEA